MTYLWWTHGGQRRFSRARARDLDEMEAERPERALEAAAQSGKLDPGLKKVDADIDAHRVKPLDEVINDA